VVAFVTSLIVLALLVMPIFALMKRRPVGASLSWGEAMFASTYVFMILFWVYGVVPHQWLTWADNELNWRPDRILVGPGEILDQLLPFTLTYLVLRDVIAAGIYIVALGINMAMFSMWQGRGEREEAKRKALTEASTSRYGRPLVKKAQA